MNEDKLLKIKGTKEIINRLRVGRTLKDYEMESRRHGDHINDAGIALLDELSNRHGADLPVQLTKKYLITRQ